MIDIEALSFNYNQYDENTLKDINLKIKKGECILLSGNSGSGKTTLTKLVNGLIPHFYENGVMKGKVLVADYNTRKTEIYHLAKHVGSVFQNPKSQFFYLDSNSELVFALENAGIDQNIMKERLKETIQDLKIENLLNRSIFRMSGGGETDTSIRFLLYWRSKYFGSGRTDSQP